MACKQILTYLVAEEAAGDVDLLTADHYDLLAVEGLLSEDRRKSAKQMALSINDDGRRGEGGHGCL